MNESERIFRNEMKNYTPLTHDEGKALLLRIREKNFPKEDVKAFANSLIPFISSKADFFKTEEVSYMDLCQESILEVIDAVTSDLINPATWESDIQKRVAEIMEDFIREETEALKAAKVLAEKLNLLDAVCQKISEKENREATVHEIAEMMKISEDEVTELLKISLQVLNDTE